MEEVEQNQHQQINNPDPPRNIIFGKYEMGRLLGKGTFAKVYYGRNLITGESVGIKVVLKDKVVKKDGPNLMEQIKREISIMRMVRHPHIVELKEVMATKGKVFFVMEYVKGGELFAKVAKGRLSEDLARKYFQQLISAVDFCHSRGICHRDLKPENLLLDENEDLKVSDFGLSALPQQLRIDGMLYTQCGTPAYVAPEVLKKKGYDGAKSDIWSCGIILFVLLAGYLPFHDENVMKLYKKAFKAQYEFPDWISEEAKSLISKLLVVDPKKRISIPEILKNPWFRVGFSNPIAFSIENDFDKDELSDEKWELMRTKSAPPFYNAFELISSMSSGFNLSSLFEKKKKSGSMFTSQYSASVIMMKLEAVAKKINFRMLWEKDFKVKMQGKEEGRKGKLGITVEVFEVVPEVAVVEFSKSSGDTLEYNKFCEEEVRPSLKDIVWSWQGEDNRNSLTS